MEESYQTAIQEKNLQGGPPSSKVSEGDHICKLDPEDNMIKGHV